MNTKKLSGGTEATLQVLECFLEHKLVVSLQNLCIDTGLSEERIECILIVLKKRGYIKNVKNSDKYILTKKFEISL